MAAAKRVLVVGGGVGGLTAAIGLRQRGVDVDLVEIKQPWTVHGVGIFQSNNALRALDRIGLAAKCAQSGGPFSGFQIYDKDGRYLMSVEASNAAAPAYPTLNGIARPELHRIFIDFATEESVSVRLGTSATDSFDDDEGCHVTFQVEQSGCTTWLSQRMASTPEPARGYSPRSAFLGRPGRRSGVRTCRVRPISTGVRSITAIVRKSA